MGHGQRPHPTPAHASAQAGDRQKPSPRNSASPCCAATSLTDLTGPAASGPQPSSCCSTASRSSRVLRLALADLAHQADGQLCLRFGDPPTPVPQPFAQLMLQQASQAALNPTSLAGAAEQGISPPDDTTGGWLFPGRNPGQPAAYATVFNQLRSRGFPMRTGRISALRQLAVQAPAPVVADALGFHHTTTHRQHINAGDTWGHYTAARRPARSSPGL